MGNTISGSRLAHSPIHESSSTSSIALSHSQSSDSQAGKNTASRQSGRVAARQPTQGLQVRDQQLSTLPGPIIELARSKHVTFLDVSKNHLKEIPDSIGRLQDLERLVVSDNLLSAMPDSIGDLGNLKYLDMTHNRVSCLPTSWSGLKHMLAVGMSECAFKHFPEVVCEWRGLRKIGFFNNAIDRLPGSIGQLSMLQKLDLSGNKLTELPAEIGKLTRLDWLNLSNNKLTRLPAEIGELVLLEELGLSNNELVELPNLQKMTRLTVLSVYNNRLVAIGEEVLGLQSLVKLDVSANQITRVDERVFTLPSMNYLNLRENRTLRRLPDNIQIGRHLTRVDLSQCQLEHIPIVLVEPTTRGITLDVPVDGNPFSADPIPLIADNFRVPSLLSLAKRELWSTMGTSSSSTVNHLLFDFSKCRQCKVCSKPYEWAPRLLSTVRLHSDQTSKVTVSVPVCSHDCKRLYYRMEIMSEFNRLEKHRQMFLVDGEAVIEWRT